MHTIIVAALAAVGLLNFAPVVAVTSRARVRAAYRVEVASADLELLLRHRAVLFGILGGFILVSSVMPALRWPAIIAGLVNMISFIALAARIEHRNIAIRRVALADMVGVIVLLAAAVLQARYG